MPGFAPEYDENYGDHDFDAPEPYDIETFDAEDEPNDIITHYGEEGYVPG
ncbi:hypothetical protein [Pantoea sp. ME81]|nr:hypothetical protein [Pantoea sp. ME81]